MTHDTPEPKGLLHLAEHLRHLGHDGLTIVGFLEVAHEIVSMSWEQFARALGH